MYFQIEIIKARIALYQEKKYFGSTECMYTSESLIPFLSQKECTSLPVSNNAHGETKWNRSRPFVFEEQLLVSEAKRITFAENSITSERFFKGIFYMSHLNFCISQIL